MIKFGLEYGQVHTWSNIYFLHAEGKFKELGLSNFAAWEVVSGSRLHGYIDSLKIFVFPTSFAGGCLPHMQAQWVGIAHCLPGYVQCHYKVRTSNRVDCLVLLQSLLALLFPSQNGRTWAVSCAEVLWTAFLCLQPCEWSVSYSLCSFQHLFLILLHTHS